MFYSFSICLHLSLPLCYFFLYVVFSFPFSVAPLVHLFSLPSSRSSLRFSFFLRVSLSFSLFLFPPFLCPSLLSINLPPHRQSILPYPRLCLSFVLSYIHLVAFFPPFLLPVFHLSPASVSPQFRILFSFCLVCFPSFVLSLFLFFCAFSCVFCCPFLPLCSSLTNSLFPCSLLYLFLLVSFAFLLSSVPSFLYSYIPLICSYVTVPLLPFLWFFLPRYVHPVLYDLLSALFPSYSSRSSPCIVEWSCPAMRQEPD